MGIRVRLALLFAAAAALLLASGGAVLVHELSSGLRGSLLAVLQTRANALAQSLPDGQGSTYQDPGAPSASLGGDQADRETLSQVLTPAGKVLSPSSPAVSRPLLTMAQLAAARRRALVVERVVDHSEAPFLLLAVAAGDHSKLVQVVGTSLSTLDDAVHRVVMALAVGGPLVVALAGLGAWMLAGAALAPVERMRRQAAEISEHDRDATLAVPGTGDEIASLARTLNRLLGRLQDALSRQRGFAASAGHELRTPLAILRAELELARRQGRSRQELAAAVDSAAEETERLVKLAEDLLVLARSDGDVLTVSLVDRDVVAVVARSVERFGERAAASSVTLALHAPAPLVAPVDESRLRQVMDNLLDNALRFAPAGTEVEVRVTAPAEEILIEVADRGPGFPPELLGRAFEQFSRADGTRARDHGGAGLGLSIVRALVEAHHGRVSASNRPAGGATVDVVLPGPGDRLRSAPSRRAVRRRLDS